MKNQRSKCSKCGKLFVQNGGNPRSRYLLVGEFPGYEEVIQGVPFVGRAGDVLKSELMLAGMQINEFQLTNLWQHERDEKNCDVTLHLDRLTKLFKGKTHVLLMGSEVASVLLGRGVSDLSGTRIQLPVYKSIRFWVSPNPAVVFHTPVGDLRLSIKRFVDDIRKRT